MDLLKLTKRPEIARVSISTNGLKCASSLDFCKELADMGASVVFCARNKEAVEALSAYSDKVTGLEADMGDRASTEAFLDKVDEGGGVEQRQVDAVVVELGHDQPVEVDPVDEEKEDRCDGQRAAHSLDVA